MAHLYGLPRASGIGVTIFGPARVPEIIGSMPGVRCGRGAYPNGAAKRKLTAGTPLQVSL
jgi:hypothetical protein